jgi:DNA invertase Pin-like site-specific DNA recombinase
MIDKIQAVHRHRLAVVYLRQSTLRQVVDHPESTRRQYALRDRAIQLGWAEPSIEIIDEDLGQSGAESTRRRGFQRLSEEVAQGRVGAILALEVSRLSRSSADWHRLLDLCGIADVLLVDEQAIYHPADPNDRLLLGIKGTMSEAERGWIQLRLRGARVSKARRGEYRLPTPAGYVWDRATSRFQFDPDEEVRGAILLVFERFRIERSAYGVMRYFAQRSLRLPARSAGAETVHWSAPRPSHILAILHNPTYAGTYVYGRRAPTVELVDGEAVRHSVRLPIDKWHIVHRDHHPAYIQWEEFVSNQRLLASNRVRWETPDCHGAVRAGEALLQGLVLCGRCGQRMHVAYVGGGAKARYGCASPVRRGQGTRTCWSVAARAIDYAVADLFLQALEPDSIALGLAVVKEAEGQAADIDRQWARRLERVQYEVQLAERRYKSVDPEYRTVARTLEREWDAKLCELERLEREHSDARVREKLELTPTDRARITQLSHDVPQMWNAATTTMQQRKTMLRTLVHEVCLTPATTLNGGTQVRLLWQTGAVSDFVVPRQLPGGNETSKEAAALIRSLVRQSMPAGYIAAELNRAGLLSGTGRRWTKPNVHAWCTHHGVRWPQPMPTSIRQPDRRHDGAYSVHGVAKRIRVKESSVRYWAKRGWLAGIEGGRRGRAWWFKLDARNIVQLKKLKAEHTQA